MNRPLIYAIVPAAGVGSRMQAAVAKQYLPLAHECVLTWTLTKLLAVTQIDKIIVALHAEDEHFAKLNIAQHEKIATVLGGDERVNSVLNALKIVPKDAWALVHDAARPCVPSSDLNRLVAMINEQHALEQQQGMILAAPSIDTIKRCQPDTEMIASTEPRELLWRALTPQVFPAQLLTRAIIDGLANGLTITDEASAVEATGQNVKLVAGSSENIKITQPGDLQLAEFYLQQQGVC